MWTTQRLALVRAAVLGVIVGLWAALAGASGTGDGWPSREPGAPAAACRAQGQGAGRAELVGGRGSRSPLEEWLAARRQGIPPGRTLHATWAVAPGGLVGDENAICDLADPVSTSEGLDLSTAAYDPTLGQLLVVWQAFDRSTQTNVYGQRVSSTGQMLGDRLAICSAPGAQEVPSVSFEATTATFWVAWTDLRSGTPEVRIRRVSAAGTLLGGELAANDGTTAAFGARIACRGGSCAVVWVEDPGDGSARVLIRSFSAATGESTSAVTPLSEPGLTAVEPDLSWNTDDDRFMAVWRQWRESSGWDIWSGHLSGSLQGLERRAVCTAIANQFSPRVAYGRAAKAYLVVWQDGRNELHWDIFGQRMTRAGAPTGGNLGIFTAPFDDRLPVVAGHDASSEFVVAFQRDPSGATGFQIYGCRVPGSGSVGGPFVVREAYNFRWSPSITHCAGSGDDLVTFSDNPLATQGDIDAQLVRDGVTVGQPIVLSRGRKGQERPAVAYGSVRGEYLAAWADFRSGADYDIYFRRVSSAGMPLGQDSALATASALCGNPALAHNPDADEFLAVWQAIPSDTAGYEIYGRRIGGGGGLLGAPILVSRDTDTHSEGFARPLYDRARGEYLVVWHAFTSGKWRVWGQRLSATGALVGNNFQVSDGEGDATNPRIARSSLSGECLVVWLEDRDGQSGVFGQRLGAGGVAVGHNFATATGSGGKGKCDVAHDPAADRYLVVWADTRSGPSEIWGRRIEADGALAGDELQIGGGDGGSHDLPSVAWDTLARELLVTWQALVAETDWDVLARRVPGDGPLPTLAFAVTRAADVQSFPELAQDARSGELFVVWQDFRKASYDVFGRRWIALPRARPHRTLSRR